MLFLYSANQLYSQNCNCTISIPSTQLIVDGNNYNIQPGDTVCLLAGNRDYLKLTNFHGDSLNYIVFKNCGGAVIVQNNYHLYGISITKSSYFKFTGSGSDTVEYGIKILETKASMNGLSISEKSTNYEIDHIEVGNAGFAGIMAKTDPVCDLSTNYGYFTQYQTYIHHNYIYNSGGEGMYIGHSFFSGYPTTCNSQPDTLYPHEIKGLKIYNNYIENSHWDGIQVGCATEDCEIYGNIIKNSGTDLVNGQNSGIQISGGTTGKCYNNFIFNGSGNGISTFGLGNNLFFNNVILNSGRNYYPSDPSKKVYGIFCDDRNTIPGLPFNFINNTIINPKTDGIRIYSLLSNNNKFYNNIIINPGSFGSYSNNNQSYIYILSGVNASLSNNYFDVNMKNIKFIDTTQNNFKLTVSSPAKDAGMDVSGYGINFDFDNYPRPYASGFDIGAYEYYPGNTVNEYFNENDVVISPNPTMGIFNLIFKDTENKNNFKIKIINQLGALIFENDYKLKENQIIDISKTAKSGLYFIILQSENYRIIKKLIIQ